MKIKLKNLDAITRIEDSKGNNITQKELKRIREGKHGVVEVDHDYLQAKKDMAEVIERDHASTNNKIDRNAPLPGMNNGSN